MAGLRNLAIGARRLTGHTAAPPHPATTRNPTRPLATLGIT
jgi:hypothetical protein